MNKKLALIAALSTGGAAAYMTGMTARNLGASSVVAWVIAICAFLIYTAVGFTATQKMTSWRDLFIIRR